MGLRDIESRLPPGFRFHPSDEELVCYYLRNKVAKANHQTVPISPATTMVEVDLHAREPWELPEVAKLSAADEWYFFSFRDRKCARGSRTNRATKLGYWKVTGKGKMIHEPAAVVVGTRKTLVFHFGRAPSGRKSGWVMHEFRLLDTPAGSPPEEDWVLCRVFHRGKGEAGLQSNSYCINGPSGSSPTITLCSPPPQRPAAASAADQSGCRRLMISSPPTINDDLQDDQLRNAGSDAQLLDLATLQAADSFLELEQGAAAVGVSSTSTMEMEMMEMESLAMSCGVLQGGNFGADGVFFF